MEKQKYWKENFWVEKKRVEILSMRVYSLIM